ncbi:MAG: divergent polysaccharide deacetylase family protein [Sulfitobacter sp.]
MAQGFLGGVFWGCVVSVGVAGVASVVADRLAPGQVTSAVETPAATAETVTDSAEVETVLSADQADPDVSDQIGTEPATTPADADTVSDSAPLPADAAPQVPQTEVVGGLNAPDTPTEGGAIVVTPDDPVEAAPQTKLADAPAEPSNLSLTTQAPQMPQTPGGTDSADLDTPRADTGVAQAPDPDINAPDIAEAVPSADDPEGTPVPQTPVVQAPQTPDATDDANEPTDDVADASDENARPTVGKPAGTLSDLGQAVVVNRLPSFEEAEPADPDAAQAMPEADMPPIQRFAAPFDNPDGKPMMSIVLIDEGHDLTAEGVGLAALRAFPYPISLAIDPNMPNAAERMNRYRAEGFEVLALINLPERANATDAEVSVAAALDVLSDAVAVIEGTGTGVQTTRAAADQVTAILAQSGHGFVTRNQGLNTVQKLAQRSGVPSATVFRDFDSKDQTQTVIRRFLDQAAFRAGQEGAVIMLGRVRLETISALLLWGLQNRASQVAMAPVSAVLTME